MTITMSARGMREQADRERMAAEETTLPLVRRRALLAAETWDRMADSAERTAAGRKAQPSLG
ncbi:hypothetical protein [Sphingomonas rubra]|uniref:Uncharacterized protein n=1 Tax=Sphingomonas rubra TaxID=634430 RepID=A0A1I5TCH9_9SPHN|nr:hypothetical protein [Sphingomonas rubra]SFP80732.1 hypothetical protein SAMN04488241_107225 [Sphingomonas rubra]